MEERMNLAEAFSALAGYGAAVWCGVAAAIATFVIEIILCKKGILFASGEKKIARAKRRGHMLTAVRTNIRFRDREPEDTTTNRLYIANYEYIVDGKVHTKQVVYSSLPPFQRLLCITTVLQTRCSRNMMWGKILYRYFYTSFRCWWRIW